MKEAKQIIKKTITNMTYRNSTSMIKQELNRSWIHTRCTKRKLFVPKGYHDLHWERNNKKQRKNVTIITFMKWLKWFGGKQCPAPGNNITSNAVALNFYGLNDLNNVCVK